MQKIYYALIFIAFFWITTVDCQGGGGGGGGRGGGGGGGGGSRGSSGSTIKCNTDECGRAIIIICVVLYGGGLGSLAIVLFCILYCRRNHGKPSVDNATFVRPNRQGHPEECRQQEVPMLNLMNSDHDKIFRNGVWLSRYRQYDKWNGPFEFTLSFDPQTWQLKGGGWDNIGKFNVIGHYSSENFRMGLTKTYIKGTGDERENLGHDVTVQVTRNKRNGIFYGKWYVDTDRYSGEDIFTLQFVRDCEYYDNV